VPPFFPPFSRTQVLTDRTSNNSIEEQQLVRWEGSAKAKVAEQQEERKLDIAAEVAVGDG